MNKEPLGLYLLRLFFGFGLFLFMLMLYWSSTLIEHDMKSVKEQLAAIRKEIASRPLSRAQSTHQSSDASRKSLAVKLIDSPYQNLLEEDPFYTVTLPKMLGEQFKPQGILRGATIAQPTNLHPFSGWGTIAQWVNLCNVAVASQKFGFYEAFSPDMALRMELRDHPKTGLPEYWIFLREGVFWEPLDPAHFPADMKLSDHFFKSHPVTAHDFKFYVDAVLNPSVQEAGAVALRTYFEDLKEIEVVDDYTFIVRWKAKEVKNDDGTTSYRLKYSSKQVTAGLRPLASFVYQYFPDGKKIIEEDENSETYRTNSVWGQNFTQHWAKNIIVSCGPWIFDGMTEREIRFKRNPNFYHPYAILVEGQTIQFKQSTEGIWQEFKGNKIDTYGIQPDQLLELQNFLRTPQYLNQVADGSAVQRLDYVAMQYAFVGWNQAKNYFKSEKVRQALTMAIDRKRIIRQTLNGMGVEINGPFFRFSSSYDESIAPWPFDPLQSRRLLEEEGWVDTQGTGVIEKEIDGQRVPFRFSLTYFVKNPQTKSICEYIATALKDVGIDCQLNGVDLADLTAAFDDKSFDALFLAWGLGAPPEDLKQLWLSDGAREKGSSNAIGFSNPEADAIIRKLEFEYNREERQKLYHRFARIIHEEAPYTFLFNPKIALLYRDYLQNVFIPAERQDLVPGANVVEPDPAIFWIMPQTLQELEF